MAVLKRKRLRPKLSRMDRLFWTALASLRISVVLALVVSRTSPWQSYDHRRIPRTYPNDGTRESVLGRPKRTSRESTCQNGWRNRWTT
jgi:hypothetical protein